MDVVALSQQPIDLLFGAASAIGADHNLGPLLRREVEDRFGFVERMRHDRRQFGVARGQVFGNNLIIGCRQDAAVLPTIGIAVTRKVAFGGLLSVLTGQLGTQVQVQNEHLLAEQMPTGATLRLKDLIQGCSQWHDRLALEAIQGIVNGGLLGAVLQAKPCLDRHIRAHDSIRLIAPADSG